MNKMKKMLKNKKGFTLVEILVVLIILAILAAVSIPAMLGFVNDAKGKAVIAEARAAYVAGQMVATEMAANGTEDGVIAAAIVDSKTTGSMMSNLLNGDAQGTISNVTMENGKVKKLSYTSSDNKYTVTIEGGKTSTVKKV